MIQYKIGLIDLIYWVQLQVKDLIQISSLIDLIYWVKLQA